MRRVMCIYLPNWPLQRLGAELRDKAVVIVKRGARIAKRGTKEKQDVLFCSSAALQARVRPGIPLAEALAIEPNLIVHEENPERDLEELKRLADWAERFSPLVGLQEESLLLDITGCASCFHGEDRLIAQAVRELTEKSYTVRAAIADTIGGAWALAHSSAFHAPRSALHIIPPGETETALLPLSIHLLRLPYEAVRLLNQLGIDTIGQLAALPRPDVAVRFGDEVLRRLDQALGRLAEPMVLHHSLPEIRASWAFEYPTARRDALHYALEQLLKEIETVLHARNRGTRYLQCVLDYEPPFSREPPASGDSALAGGSRLNEDIDIRLVRPSRSACYLGDLLRTRLEQIRFSGPVREICLRVPVVEVLSEQQSDLYGEDSIHETSELQMLLDRLSSRLGREAVTLPRLVPDPQPEFACKFEPILSGERRARSAERNNKPPVPRSALCAPRFTFPLVLFPPKPLRVRAVVPEGPPYKIEWRGQQYDVRHAWGPERIETGWWRGQDIHRDYYIIETDQGSRLWIFRRHEDGRWFLHGSFE